MTTDIGRRPNKKQIEGCRKRALGVTGRDQPTWWVCHLSSSISSMTVTSLRSAARLDDITVSRRRDTAVQYFPRNSVESVKANLRQLAPLLGSAAGTPTVVVPVAGGYGAAPHRSPAGTRPLVRWRRLSRLGLAPVASRRGLDCRRTTVEHNLRPGEGTA